jgi:CRP-like cAMP-binding protein
MSEASLDPQVASPPQGAAKRPPGLESLRLLSEVEDAAARQLLSKLIVRRFAAGAVIVEEGLPGDFMYWIREGRVKETIASGDGRERIATLLSPGDFFGELSLLDRAPRSATATALEVTTLLALSRTALCDLQRASPGFSAALLRALASRLREVDDEVSAHCFLGVEERTLRVIEGLSKASRLRAEASWCVAVTHQQLADRVGSSRESVTRALRRLLLRGTIEQSGRRYRRVATRPSPRGPVRG